MTPPRHRGPSRPRRTRRTSCRSSRHRRRDLEEVAHALGIVGDELDGVALLDELREHQQPHVGQLPPDHERGAHAVVGVIRRHLHIDDRDVGAVLAHGLHERVSIAGLRDHDEPGIRQQTHEALAQEDLILATTMRSSSLTRRHGRPRAHACRCPHGQNRTRAFRIPEGARAKRRNPGPGSSATVACPTQQHAGQRANEVSPGSPHRAGNAAAMGCGAPLTPNPTRTPA